jgi:hypothetical protein
VHIVGRLDSDDAHSLLWPTVLALADAGVRQAVLLLHPGDAEHARLLLPREVPLVVAREAGLWLHRPAKAAECLRAQLRAEPVLAVHLHGSRVALSGLRAMRDCGLQAPVFFHAPEQPAPPTRLRAGARWLARWGSRPLLAEQQAAFVVLPGRVDPLRAARAADDALAQPLRDDFFHITRAESPHPLIVTSGRPGDVAFASGYAQLAVLMAGSDPNLQFAWIGEADDAVQAVLKAAHVQVLPARHELERAAHLAQAWLYVAPEGSGAEARGVVEAMAVGLPCVARDGVACRDLVIDQLSGFVCARTEELITGIARLVDAAALRQEMGEAARARSLQRHSRHRFQASMLLAHGLPTRLETPAARFGLQPALA